MRPAAGHCPRYERVANLARVTREVEAADQGGPAQVFWPALPPSGLVARSALTGRTRSGNAFHSHGQCCHPPPPAAGERTVPGLATGPGWHRAGQASAARCWLRVIAEQVRVTSFLGVVDLGRHQVGAASARASSTSPSPPIRTVGCPSGPPLRSRRAQVRKPGCRLCLAGTCRCVTSAKYSARGFSHRGRSPRHRYGSRRVDRTGGRSASSRAARYTGSR